MVTALYLGVANATSTTTPGFDGQTTSTAPTTTPATLDEVTVVGTRTPRSVRESTGMVTVIDQQQIDEQLAQNIQDLARWYSLTPALCIDTGVFDLSKQKYWSWSSVQGQVDGDPTIERYTSPGINGSVLFATASEAILREDS